MIVSLRDLKMGLTPDDEDDEYSELDEVLGENESQMDYLDIEVKLSK